MLKLPLHCYDEAGRILPPRWLYWLIGLACADWVLLVFALASRAQTSTLLGIFYPDRWLLAANLIATLPLVIAAVMVSQRERLWKRRMFGWVGSLRPLLLTGLAGSLVIQIRAEALLDWHFSAYSSGKLILLSALVYCVIRSRHLRWMIADWRTPGQ